MKVFAEKGKSGASFVNRRRNGVRMSRDLPCEKSKHL
jgi:hypothetical protein